MNPYSKDISRSDCKFRAFNNAYYRLPRSLSKYLMKGSWSRLIDLFALEFKLFLRL